MAKEIDNPKAKRIQKRMEDRLGVYLKKNKLYGDAFSKTFQQYGPISALTRMRDKMDRLETLILNPQFEDNGESILDTLMDLANYCDMTIEEFESLPVKETPKKKPAKKKTTKGKKKASHKKESK